MAYENLTYGDNISIPVADIPEVSRFSLMQQAFGHKIGNEAAATVSAKIQAFLGDAKDSTDLKAWREANREMVDAWTSEARAGIIQKIMNGTLGIREGGPRKDPVEVEVAALGLNELVQSKVLKRSGKNDDVITFPNGATMARGELLKRYVAKHGDRLTPEAAKIVRARQNAEKKAEAPSVTSLEDLGL